MRVKELLLRALSRANHIEDGTPADSRELSKARSHLESALSKYSSSNLITAFQRMTDVPYAERQTVGKYNLKRGKVMHEAETVEGLPDASRLTNGNDFGHTRSDDRYYVVDVMGGRNVWYNPGGETPSANLELTHCCDYVPDVIVPDIERIMACMYRLKGEQTAFAKMNFVPLVNFYADPSKDIFSASPVGENKVELLLPSGMDNCEFRIVYYAEMHLADDDYIELPDAYKELLTLAVTVGLLSEDADSDPKQLANYSAQLTSMEDLIGATNVTTRRLTREPDGSTVDSLRSGAFIRRRLCR
ncbi:MAG: hypothetical protein J6U20_09905 [Fibrobacter sp.]|nr:hypothetical protein [Fibrobacter sp.]